MPPEPAAEYERDLARQANAAHARGDHAAEAEAEGRYEDLVFPLRPHNRTTYRLQQIASKVDAGEPVDVEPGGYQALTDDELARLTLSWPWSDGDDPAERLAQRYGVPAVAKKLSLRPPTLSEPESKWVGCFDDLAGLEFAWDWQAGDPDPGFGRPPDIPDSWRWTTLGLAVAALAVWRWRHGR